MISFIDNLFQGPISILQSAISFLANLAMVAASGINLSDYFSWISVLDPSWQAVVDSFLASFTFISMLFIVRAVYRAYLSFKSGIKWW